jgi:mannan endo-1,4-beta-mannosidase
MRLTAPRLVPGGSALRRASLAGLALAFLPACVREAPGPAQAPAGTTRDGLDPSAQQQLPTTHFHVQGRQLFDRCGEPVVLRGINEMVIWTAPEGQTFPEIAKTGANTVRVVWTIKDHPGEEQLDRVLARAILEKLIPIIELHDATGNLAEVPRLVDFWVRPEIIRVLKKHEHSLLLNIANEAGSKVELADYVSTYTSAIQKLRGAGLELPLMIDAPGWGQDIDTLQAAAPRLMQADPQRNLLFSVHMWWAKGPTSDDPGSTRRIRAEIEESVAMNLPLVIGEFAHAGVGCSRSIDYATILSEAERAGIGWLAWSWGPGNKDCGEMDMTTAGTFDTLQGWGREVSLEHAASIQKTSKIPESMQRGECAVQRPR